MEETKRSLPDLENCSDPRAVAHYRYSAQVLEIGSAFGLRSPALVQGAAGLGMLISLGVFSRQCEIEEQSGWPFTQRYEEERFVSDGRNMECTRAALGRPTARVRPEARVPLHRINTQPESTDSLSLRPRLTAHVEAFPTSPGRGRASAAFLLLVLWHAVVGRL